MPPVKKSIALTNPLPPKSQGDAVGIIVLNKKIPSTRVGTPVTLSPLTGKLTYHPLMVEEYGTGFVVPVLLPASSVISC